MKKDVGPMTTQGLEKRIQKFEEMDPFHVQSGRGRKRVQSMVVEEVATAVQEESSGGLQPFSVWGITRTLCRLVSTWYKIQRNILCCCPYKISHEQELLLSDLPARENLILPLEWCGS
ncbi:DUF4817 domain-containing protein [Trichonephila clavipes]|nr:DUF4817 domain-containing protein [Trichonephila clavipes]